MYKLFLATLILLSGLAFNFAQAEPSEAERYKIGLQEGRKKMELLPRRITRSEKDFSDKVLVSTCDVIEEILSSKISRLIRKSQVKNERCAYEQVKIDNFLYERKGSDTWTKIDLANPGNDRIVRLGALTQENTLREYVVTKSQLEGVQVTVYFHYEVFESNSFLTFIQDYDWVNSAGLIVKSQTKISSVIPENVTRTVDGTYEYKPKDLKIEAPIK